MSSSCENARVRGGKAKNRHEPWACAPFALQRERKADLIKVPRVIKIYDSERSLGPFCRDLHCVGMYLLREVWSS